MFNSLKAKLIGLFAFVAAATQSAYAGVLTEEEKTSLTTSLQLALGEYISLMITVVVVTIPVTLIAHFLWYKVGKGGKV